MKKYNLIGYILLLIGFIFIPQVHALKLENITVLNANDSYKGGTPEVVGNGTSNVTITYNAANLKIVPADMGIGRTIDAAWVGAQIVAPKDISIETLKQATYKSGNSEDQLFWNSQDTLKQDYNEQSKPHFINVFGAVIEEHLEKATIENKMITYTWTFDWDHNGETDQTVTMKINPTGVVLQAKEDDTVLWNFDKYEEVKKANEEKEEPKEEEKEDKKDDVPKTGDVVGASAIAFMSLLLSGIYLMKQYRK